MNRLFVKAGIKKNEIYPCRPPVQIEIYPKVFMMNPDDFYQMIIGPAAVKVDLLFFTLTDTTL
jgi:hypothetical protein